MFHVEHRWGPVVDPVPLREPIRHVAVLDRQTFTSPADQRVGVGVAASSLQRRAATEQLATF
jgi:hypothetical protein